MPPHTAADQLPESSAQLELPRPARCVHVWKRPGAGRTTAPTPAPPCGTATTTPPAGETIRTAAHPPDSGAWRLLAPRRGSPPHVRICPCHLSAPRLQVALRYKVVGFSETRIRPLHCGLERCRRRRCHRVLMPSSLQCRWKPAHSPPHSLASPARRSWLLHLSIHNHPAFLRTRAQPVPAWPRRRRGLRRRRPTSSRRVSLLIGAPPVQASPWRGPGSRRRRSRR
mmetsp:Transcript_12064/g.26884  ORF Transcript_12064/g.26884 Transcript_12064/m.26884 type:complete len:226 (-) Transcript_12064:211-888(-)